MSDAQSPVKRSYLAEAQSIISISYLIAIGIGMLFRYKRFAEFEINIFDYADVFDFIIAPFSDTRIFYFSLLSGLLSVGIIRLDAAWQARYPKSYSKMVFGWDKKPWYSVVRYVSFVSVFIAYLNLSADIYGKLSKEDVMKQAPVTVRFVDNELKQGKVIGKTQDMLFMINGEKIEVVPLTSLVKEVIVGKKKK
ncbi:MAG: hypothetical protein AB7O48_18625 [Cyclobacteriaceae bacterium]